MLEKGPERLDGAQLARLGWCLAALQAKPGQLLMARYLVAAGGQLEHMEPRSLSDTLWACAMLDEKPAKPWLDCFLAESRKHLPAFPAGALVPTPRI
ncbi:hypothetical protein OEZ86_013841 [Tetradesmus obliquus]|nr:hypothetical protein OEZ86_013841 [Tetradesmus obliquus]